MFEVIWMMFVYLLFLFKNQMILNLTILNHFFCLIYLMFLFVIDYRKVLSDEVMADITSFFKSNWFKLIATLIYY